LNRVGGDTRGNKRNPGSTEGEEFGMKRSKFFVQSYPSALKIRISTEKYKPKGEESGRLRRYMVC
jgi:hypothetical protein